MKRKAAMAMLAQGRVVATARVSSLLSRVRAAVMRKNVKEMGYGRDHGVGWRQQQQGKTTNI